MCDCIREYYGKTGRKVGFKLPEASPPPKTRLCITPIVDTILGPDWLNPSLLRFGASRVANSILSEVEKSSVIYF